jgi:hypothetical protein|tara:strand:- start:4175 stop:6001 length:1827 start_codon:yes stop_codon:yes gene_type:complete
MATSTGKTLDYNTIVHPDALAGVIGDMYARWKADRSVWEQEVLERRNFLFATDTTKTSNASLPWKNKTTRPKLTQIRDNLHANYMAALFPHEDFFSWSGESPEGIDDEKANIIQAYMRNKVSQSKFMETMSQIVYDYIDYGNAFGEVVYVRETAADPDGGPDIIRYNGPKLVRISPLNIVFDIRSASFQNTPNITRTLVSIGELAKMRKDLANETGWIDEAFQDAIELRQDIGSGRVGLEDALIKSAIRIDGFGDPHQYYQSGQVEILEFNGDLYDIQTNELLSSHRVIVIDRAKVVYKGPYQSWLGRQNKEHVGWRQRPDNLMAMGPLDNLVGMQYRIDHLENLKADVFDQIAHPVVYQRGEFEDWNWGPGEKIMGDVDSHLEILRPDTTALNADFQIQELERTMEDMAGAPRQAMGIRTPGEKTAFEVQTLENNTGRTFQHKTAYFDTHFVEPILNQMLASARMNLDTTDQIRIQDPSFGTVKFEAITKEDLQAKGTLVPKGAKHFTRKAQLLQNLSAILNTAGYADPGINVHMSGLKIAATMEELADLKEFAIVKKDIRIVEQTDTQKTMQAGQEIAQENLAPDPRMGEALDGVETVEPTEQDVQ